MKYKMRKIFACAFAVLCGVTLIAQSRVTQEHKDRAAEIVSQMTLEEKIDERVQAALTEKEAE